MRTFLPIPNSAEPFIITVEMPFPAIPQLASPVGSETESAPACRTQGFSDVLRKPPQELQCAVVKLPAAVVAPLTSAGAG